MLLNENVINQKKNQTVYTDAAMTEMMKLIDKDFK